MKYFLDTHTHTIASGHAYTTFLENVKAASDKGLKLLGTTDHGPNMPGGPHLFHFGNMKVLPREMMGVTLIYGCEANIIDYSGNIDMPERLLKSLDITIASLHDVCIKPGTIEENTQALLNVMDNPYVHIIGHAGNPAFPIDYEKVVKKAKKKNILMEINNSSFTSSREGSQKNCSLLARLCKENEVKIILGSDAHASFLIGEFKEADEMLEKIEMPKNLIINTDVEGFIKYLKNKGKLQDIVLD